MQKDRAKASFKGLLTSAQLPRLISLGSYEKFQPGFRDGKRPKILGTKSWPNTKNLTFGPIIASVTLKSALLQLNGKIHQAMQDDASRTARIHPAVHMAKFPARRMKLQKSLETPIFCELARFEREESVKRKWNKLLRSAMSNESGEKKETCIIT